MAMNASIKWTDGRQFLAESGSGHSVVPGSAAQRCPGATTRVPRNDRSGARLRCTVVPDSDRRGARRQPP